MIDGFSTSSRTLYGGNHVPMRQGALHVAVTSPPVRMTSHARAVASILSPLGGGILCVGAARPAPLDKQWEKEVVWGGAGGVGGGVTDRGE